MAYFVTQQGGGVRAPRRRRTAVGGHTEGVALTLVKG